ncbi:MAG: ABC transporter ATP-binding protein [Actinomycetota bacterium]|nr:ABC transporter ATP-binding protein [Actinomycetota bacterium]
MQVRPVLELVGVVKRYRVGTDEIVAVDHVDLAVVPGEVVAIVGPSGSGKSTLLHLAAGIDLPDAGEVRFDGKSLAHLSASARARLRRRGIGLVFQFFQLLPGLTAQENVELPLVFDGDPAAGLTAQRMLASVGLAGKAARLPGELSGGEMQRVAVARALVAGARLILADEPTGNLDSATGTVVLDALFAAVRDTGAALVVVTHDMATASRADRTLALYDGRFEGTAPGAVDRKDRRPPA